MDVKAPNCLIQIPIWKLFWCLAEEYRPLLGEVCDPELHEVGHHHPPYLLDRHPAPLIKNVIRGIPLYQSESRHNVSNNYYYNKLRVLKF